jgi:hypothetical protein
LNINTNQQNYTFDLLEILGVSFDDNSMIVETTTMFHTFLFDDILYLDFDTTTGVESKDIPNSMSLLLNQNYPNPFNPETNISFSLVNSEEIKIEIFNSKGQKVRSLVNGTYSAGEHTVNWNGRNDKQEQVTSGIYFYELSSKNSSVIKKMMLIK